MLRMTLGRIFALTLCLAMSGFSAALPAVAREIHVNNRLGDDRRDGSVAEHTGSSAGPVRTIEKALRLCRSGDTISLANTGEPYRECVTFSGGRHSGSAVGPVVLDGHGAILDGSQEVPLEAWQHYRDDWYRFRPQRLAFQLLFDDGYPLVRQPVVHRDGRLPKLEPLQWCLTAGWLYFRTEQDKLPSDYALAQVAHPVGITLFQVHDVVLRDLVVQGFHLDGIAAHDLATGCRLEHVTLRGNGRAGLSVGGASDVAVDLCLLGDNGRAQLWCEDFAHVEVRQSELLPESAPAIITRGGEVRTDEATRAASQPLAEDAEDARDE